MTSIPNISNRLRLTLAALSVAAVLTPVHAQTPPGPTMAKPAAAASGMDHSKMSKDGKMTGHSGSDMASSMDHMNSTMSAMKSTGNPDIDFAMMMRIHHQGAITMAETELKNGKDSQMKKMAKAIIAAQKKEIATFDKFLASKGQPVTPMKP